MSQENQYSSALDNLPVKRKRGRPRKDEKLIHGETPSVMPATDMMKRSRPQMIDPTTDTIVGQIVSGVLEGSFDAGYLLTVKVGDTDTVLRGIVFKPGLSMPISMENDVAPDVKMFKRNEIPLSLVGTPTQVAGSTLRFEQKNERPVKFLQRNEVALPSKVSPPVNLVPRAPRLSPSQLQTGPLVASNGESNGTKHVPQTAPQALLQTENKTESSANLLAKGLPGDVSLKVQVSSQAAAFDVLPNDKTNLPARQPANSNQAPLVMTQQAVQSELKSEPFFATQPPPLEDDQTSKPTEMLQENDASALMRGPPINVDAPKDSNLESQTEPSVEILQGSETFDQVAQVQHQAMVSELKPGQTVDDAFKGSEVEYNRIPVIDVLQSVASNSINEPTHVLQCELANEIPKTDETSHLNGRPQNDATKSAEGDSQSEPKTNQPVEMLRREATPAAPLDSEAEIADIQAVLPKEMPEPQISHSPVPNTE